MSFDRVADVYDATRGLPESVADDVAKHLAEAVTAGPETRFLELGVGTGRIALPLIRAGYSYTGVDISEAMLSRLRDKAGNAPNLTIVEGDIGALPFPDGSFDVVLAVHVLHLVPDFRRVLNEARRVLTPNGHFVLGYDGAVGNSPARRIRRQWRVFVDEQDGGQAPRRVSSDDVYAALTEMGGRIALYHVARWERTVVPRDLIALIHQRKYSWTWDIPQPVLDAANTRMLAWTEENIGDLDKPLPAEWEFTLGVTTFD